MEKNKFDFENTKKGNTFKEESDLYAGEEVTVRNNIYLYLKLYLENIKNKNESFKETFKSGQDFEYVKYKIAHKLQVNQNDIDLYNNDKKLIPMFSICDVELNDDKKIHYEIKNDNNA